MDVFYEIQTQDFYYRTDAISPVLTCGAHMHYHIEVLYILEGENEAVIDSVKYPLRGGDLCIVFPNRVHQFKTQKKEKYILSILSPDLVPEFADIFSSCVPKNPVIHFNEGEKAPIELLGRACEISRLDPRETYKDVMLKGALLSFFGHVFERMEFEKVDDGGSTALKAVVDYCSRNFCEDLSLSLLEEKLHISKYYISHLFGDKMNVSFNDYINQLRITEACRQLKYSGRSITEISELVGFNTLRTFNRAFSKFVGMSPSEYRRFDVKYIDLISMNTKKYRKDVTK